MFIIRCTVVHNDEAYVKYGHWSITSCVYVGIWHVTQVIVMLLESKDYRFIRVEEFGRVNSYNPRTTGGDVQTMVSVRYHTNQYTNYL